MPVLFDDTYSTIAGPAESLFKDKGSKFLAYAFPIQTDDDAKFHLASLRELHPKAVHHCYAYRLGTDKMAYRMSDDGEPSGTAGRPILNTLYSKNLTNLIIVVVRYFGGTLLGVPGLIHAYKSASELALADGEIVTKHLSSIYQLSFSYLQMNEVMKIVKDLDLAASNQLFEMECRMNVEVRASLIEPFFTRCEKVKDLIVTQSS
ncbi:YigZ family protein [Dyadobacter sp. CY323]|uniref:IMPACT family protein n=1 Tax=Dyadobacter sp. CY323 TaxID=2907302 RepID=UPI001F247ACC|nr:YigZ family protein [Dyadobacter sp. CY323]MCE6992823.1 YigZ family protein [Dyadobacter sp. CY323]